MKMTILLVTLVLLAISYSLVSMERELDDNERTIQELALDNLRLEEALEECRKVQR